MPDTQPQTEAVTPPPAPCSLRQACIRAELYRGGERCPGCALRTLCQTDMRWLIRSGREYRC